MMEMSEIIAGIMWSGGRFLLGNGHFLQEHQVVLENEGQQTTLLSEDLDSKWQSTRKTEYKREKHAHNLQMWQR